LGGGSGQVLQVAVVRLLAGSGLEGDGLAGQVSSLRIMRVALAVLAAGA